MLSHIRDQIATLEDEMGIRVLCAVESGSRAWGFASPDSDYDVRLIYTYPKNDYISVAPVVQDINLPVDDLLLDLSGWELLKAARLVVGKCNASPFEWMQSSIVYQQQPGFIDDFFKVLETYFQPIPMVHHYLGLAKGTFYKHLQADQVNIKKYFYALRPILCAQWILERQTIPPLLFSEVRKVLDDSKVNTAFDEFLVEKEQAPEGHMVRANPVLQNFVITSIQRLTDELDRLKPIAVNHDLMNEFLFRWIV